MLLEWAGVNRTRHDGAVIYFMLDYVVVVTHQLQSTTGMELNL